MRAGSGDSGSNHVSHAALFAQHPELPPEGPWPPPAPSLRGILRRNGLGLGWLSRADILGAVKAGVYEGCASTVVSINTRPSANPNLYLYSEA